MHPLDTVFAGAKLSIIAPQCFVIVQCPFCKELAKDWELHEYLPIRVVDTADGRRAYAAPIRIKHKNCPERGACFAHALQLATAHGSAHLLGHLSIHAWLGAPSY
jgi:hypothetical protein